MGTIGTIDAAIVSQIKPLFEQRCVALLKWAAITLKSTKAITVDWDEENITANIYELIRNSQDALDHNITPEYDYPVFNQDILNNKKRAKTTPRIDLVFQHNWKGHHNSFYVEAKNLIENDVLKTGRKRKTKASTLLNRYIKTGIDHYIDAYYPHGCMLGYVLNGTIVGVVGALNKLLNKKSREVEILCDPAGAEPWVCYQSHHRHSLKISHYLFDFN